MSLKVSYVDWLENYAERPYKSTTIKQYISALEKAPERLGIELPRSVLSCSSLGEFEEVNALITGHPDYDHVNKSYGHSSLSAALATFKKYIFFAEKMDSLGGDANVYTAEWYQNVAKSEELITFDEEAVSLRKEFCEQFSIEKLEALTGRDLLTKLFYSDEENKTNLCYMLEFHPRMRELFGSIAGGSSFKYGLFYHKKSHSWMTGSPVKPQALTEEQAIGIAGTIRSKLVAGAKMIEANAATLTTVSAYEELYKKLQPVTNIDWVWVLKYYQMLFPELLPVFYAKDIQIAVLRFIKQEPSAIPFVRMGQIALHVKECGISSPVFGRIYGETYHVLNSDAENPDGDDVDTLSDANVRGVHYWMYMPGEGSVRWQEFYEKGIMALDDHTGIGDLRQYDSKETIKQKMKETYNPSYSYLHTGLAAWQFANEIRVGDIVFVKKGRGMVVGRGIVTSDYEYDASVNDEYKNIRRVNWTHNGEWSHPIQVAQKTLTDITDYTDSVENLIALFAEDEDSEPEVQEVVYPPYSATDFLADVYMQEEEYNTLVNLIRTKKNIILQGAPGVGKTYAAKRLAYSMMGVKDQNRVMMVQFHQSYSYEDFIEGYRPAANGFVLNKGAFYKFCKTAEMDDENEYFFIIDEINRGNLSKIFGELFMLIESDKRGIQLQLLYSGEKFAVPKNVYIIGMMNTADHSLAMLDYALRRRFAFYEMRPGFDTDGFREYRMGLSSEKFDRLIHCVESLNNVIAADESLGDGFCVGHSYFCNLTAEKVTDRALSAIVEYELIPLLKEYWFDEPLKVKDWTNNLRSAVK